MKNIKKVLAIYSVIIIGLNLSLLAFTCQKIVPEVNSDNIKNIITAWVNTDSFSDMAYSYNIHGINESITALVESYNSDIDTSDICIASTIHNFNGTDQDHRIHCTSGTTLTKLTSNAKEVELVTGDIILQIGAQILGHVEYYIAAHHKSISYAHLVRKKDFLIFCLLINIVVVTLMGMLCKTILTRTSEKIELDSQFTHDECNTKITALIESHDAELAQLKALHKKTLEVKTLELEADQKGKLYQSIDEERLSILKKISNNNKKVFPINDEVIYVSYSHPDAIIYSKSKDERSFRSSLSDIASAFHIDFIHLNRKIMLNKAFVNNRNHVTTIESGKKLKVTIKSKKGEEVVEVSNSYRDAFAKLLKNENKLNDNAT